MKKASRYNQVERESKEKHFHVELIKDNKQK